tara:strand:- start:895 stop:1428 length:534 start_codon:yes stop_codon:yes gene_type:complete
MKSIAVYCGSSNKVSKKYRDEAIKVGEYLAQNNFKIVYGGGNMGLMGDIANSAIDKGGDVFGIITEHLIDIEKKNESLNNLKVVTSMHERKIEMYNRADMFLIFPGGIGTLEEFFEVYSWKQLGLHSKAIIIYNYDDYWNELIMLIDNLINQNFAGVKMKDEYKIVTNLSELEKIIK